MLSVVVPPPLEHGFKIVSPALNHFTLLLEIAGVIVMARPNRAGFGGQVV
jgi:hypothetical protein